MKKKRLHIAIIGLGTIVAYLFNYLNLNKSQITKKNGVELIISSVSAHNKKNKRYNTLCKTK